MDKIPGQKLEKTLNFSLHKMWEPCFRGQGNPKNLRSQGNNYNIDIFSMIYHVSMWYRFKYIALSIVSVCLALVGPLKGLAPIAYLLP